ncbi:MAG: ABC transporter ATP-binding protein [Desulfurococcales archaeon]|nr:ABC transporter ATP-binding protein [Desulfurococcales archaeon]
MGLEACSIPVLELKGFEAWIDGFRVGPVSLEVRGGIVQAIIGPNGSGKTTLLKGIGGILPSRGSILFCGREAPRVPGRAGLVDYVPAEPQADPYARVEEIFRVSSIGLEGVLDELSWLLEVAGRRFGSLSMGQRKLLCVLRGLFSRRPVLLLDEPLSHLDVAWQSWLINKIKDISKYKIIIISLHELHLLSELADRALLLDNGRPVLNVDVLDIGKHLALIERVYRTNLRAISGEGYTIILPFPKRGPREAENRGKAPGETPKRL